MREDQALFIVTYNNDKEKAMAAEWQIGCFTRPWSEWSFDEALDGMKAAGFHTIGLLGNHKGEPFLRPGVTNEYLDGLKQRIEARGLKAIFGRMGTRHDVPVPEAIESACQQIDQAQYLEIPWLMSLGVYKPEEYEHFYEVMAGAAAYAEPRGVKVIFKPHGGVSNTTDDVLTCLEKVHHPNFSLWYDAGNVIHYTGEDPVAEVERVAPYVTGFCAKDCAERGGDVMIQFGDGKVDFAGVFRRLQAAGYNGPVMIECCTGQTFDEVNAKAAENRQFLERLFASL